MSSAAQRTMSAAAPNALAAAPSALSAAALSSAPSSARSSAAPSTISSAAPSTGSSTAPSTPSAPSPTLPPTVLASTRAVIDGRLTAATLVLSPTDGTIAAIHEGVLPAAAFPAGTVYRDHSPAILLPGLVDAHVHLNEPGRTAWEGFWTGTRAAAFGGVTTVVDMPLNAIPPTVSVAALDEKLAAAQDQCWVDVAFYGGLVPGNVDQLRPLVQRGVRGFKGFLIDSGVDEFPAVSPDDVRAAMVELADAPTTLLFHAEMEPPSPTLFPSGPADAYATFLASRPAHMESRAIAQLVALAPIAPRLPLHVVHLSAVEALPLLRAAQAAGARITAETCFHYLTLAAEAVPRGDTRHKCCPPIRGAANREGLWSELRRGADSVVQTVVSDHSPCTPELKLLPASVPGAVAAAEGRDDGDFMKAWGGVSSVGLGLALLWTEGRPRGISIEDVVRWCCANTARQVGLDHVKGRLAVGMDADVAVFDDDQEWTVGLEAMLFRNKCSPYQGRTLTGVVKETWVRGVKVYDRESGFAEAPTGKTLLEVRKAA